MYFFLISDFLFLDLSIVKFTKYGSFFVEKKNNFVLAFILILGLNLRFLIEGSIWSKILINT